MCGQQRGKRSTRKGGREVACYCLEWTNEVEVVLSICFSVCERLCEGV